MKKLRLLDLFSGIGGFSLGLERSGGFETVAFCEIDHFCRRVLAKHWPKVPCYDDVRQLSAERLAADGIAVDVICGGFPCTDISVAGKGAGLSGPQSGLWREYARLIGELRPRFVIVENVAALLGRGLSDVLGDMAALGYDAEWNCIPASAVGAPHRRDRFWLVADSCGLRRNPLGYKQSLQRIRMEGQSFVADSNCPQCEGNSSSFGILAEHADISCAGRWASEPAVGRVAHGVPNRVDRLRGLGNAVVPQIPELIGRAIMESMQ